MEWHTTFQAFLLWLSICLSQSQTLIGPSSATVEQGVNTTLTCSVQGGTAPTITWTDGTVPIYSGGNKLIPAEKYDNFFVDLSATSSDLIITGTQIEDEGDYTCISSETTESSDIAEVSVEVNSTLTLDFTSAQDDRVTVQCDSVDGRPQVDITWYINGQVPTEIPTVTNPTNNNPDLSNTRSVLVYEGSPDDTTIACQITGHNIADLNYRKTESLDPPSTADSSIFFDFTDGDASIEVCCRINGSLGQPEANYYYIYSDGSLIHQSGAGENCGEIDLTDPDVEAEFPVSCSAGNYLGNITGAETYNYSPPSPTTSPPTTSPGGTTAFTTYGRTGDPGKAATTTGEPAGNDARGSDPNTTNVAAIAGGVVGGIVVLVLIGVLVWYFVSHKDSGKSSGGSSSYHSNKSSHQPVATTTVTTNNEEEPSHQPVETTITTRDEDETESAPVAAPRNAPTHTVTPSGDEYAMVTKKGSGGNGGDYLDSGNGKSQEPEDITMCYDNADPGLHYADLDLNTGHTEQHVPQNPNEVTVYSSIVV